MTLRALAFETGRRVALLMIAALTPTTASAQVLDAAMRSFERLQPVAKEPIAVEVASVEPADAPPVPSGGDDRSSDRRLGSVVPSPEGSARSELPVSGGASPLDAPSFRSITGEPFRLGARHTSNWTGNGNGLPWDPLRREPTHTRRSVHRSATSQTAARSGGSAIGWGIAIGIGAGVAVSGVAAARYGENEGGEFCARCFVQWSAISVPVGAGIGAAAGYLIDRARR
jgi:hypothetical protein